jgi:hypothetical protein
MKMPTASRISLGSRATEWVARNFHSEKLLTIYQDMHRQALESKSETQNVEYRILIESG